MQPITAESGDEDDEPDGYVFFVDSKGEIAGLFHKSTVESCWITLVKPLPVDCDCPATWE